MKKLLIISALFFSAFFTKAEQPFSNKKADWGQGPSSLALIVTSIENGSISEKLACTPEYWYQTTAYGMNIMTGYGLTGDHIKNGWLNNDIFVMKWPCSDLMNCALLNGKAHFYQMLGNSYDSVWVYATIDNNNRKIPIGKAEGTNNLRACANPVYSRTIRPYKEKSGGLAKTETISSYDLPTEDPLEKYFDLPVEEGYVAWPTQAIPMNVPVVQINTVWPVQPATVFLPQAPACCQNTISPPNPTPAPNPGWHGGPVEGEPGWPTHTGNDYPISGDPG